jgi:hypothetical protein
MKLKSFLILFVVFAALFAYAEVPTLPDCETTSIKTGKEADKDIFRLHGKEIDFEDSYVAEYFCKNGSTAIIWASFSKTEKEASDLFKLMDDKMPSSKVFRNRMEFKSGGHNIIYVTGMGMDNYYFVDGKANYWIAAKGKDTVDILKKFTQTIK